MLLWQSALPWGLQQSWPAGHTELVTGATDRWDRVLVNYCSLTVTPNSIFTLYMKEMEETRPRSRLRQRWRDVTEVSRD